MLTQHVTTTAAYLLAGIMLVPSGTAAADNHSDTLAELHALESRLLDAGSLCIEFEIHSEGAVGSELQGTSRMIRPDSARIEADGEFAKINLGMPQIQLGQGHKHKMGFKF